MVPVLPIIINIENLTDDNAQAILDVFIKNLGPVKHTDGVSFFRDLQPVCREVKAKARLVGGVQAEIIDRTTEKDEEEHMERFTVTVINTDGNQHPVNCILALSKDVNDLYEISKTAIFVPAEICRPGKSISVDFDVEVHDEFDDDFEDEEGGEDANDAESAAATESDN